MDKYLSLARELWKLLDMKVRVVLVVFGALYIVPNEQWENLIS